MKLLTLNQVKMLKSQKLGYLSAILNLSPAYKYKGNNTCPYAGQCKGFCLQNGGRNRFPIAHAARIRRTEWYYDDPGTFYFALYRDILSVQDKAKREGLIPTIRLNGLSDIPFEKDDVVLGSSIFYCFPDVQFIDYTKDADRMFQKNIPENYHLTYSINESTDWRTIKKVYEETRFNCAAVFLSPDLPVTSVWGSEEYSVVNGDESDLRHLDPRSVKGRPAIVGLKYKLAFSKRTGKAIRPKNSGFIILN